jgi:hypothetical protein
MSRLSARRKIADRFVADAYAVLMVAACWLWTTQALAEPAAPTFAEIPSSSPFIDRWNVDARLSYGASFTTGQSYLGIGTGLAGGLTFGIPFHVEVGAMWFGGSKVSAQNSSLQYSEREWSTYSHLAAGYDIRAWQKHLVLRPQAIFGIFATSDTLSFVGAMGNVRERQVFATVALGPSLAVFGKWPGFHLGMEGQALLFPSRIAAPAGILTVVVGLER